MQLFIQKGCALKRIPEVTLKDCVCPKIRQVEKSGVEPALWYKVLVCEAILVDLDNRLVRWTVGDGLTLKEPPAMSGRPAGLTVPLSDEKLLEYFKTGESLFEDDDCKEYDSNVEEMFQISADIHNDLDLGVFDTTGNEGVYEKALKLMHVYILPYIRFQTKHYSHVKLVLETTDTEYKRLESKIDGKSKEKHKADLLLRTMREKMILRGDFERKDFERIETTFLEVFLKHVENDIARLNTDFVVIENKIEPLRGSNNEADKQMMSTLRAQRSAAFDSLNAFLTVREQIKQYLNTNERHERHVVKRSLDLLRRFQDNDIRTVYQRIVGNINDMITEIRDIMDTKLKVSAVREEVTFTLQELDTFGASFGYNQKKGILDVGTGVVGTHKKPNSWLTLQEQVSSLLNSEARFRDSFEDFCSKTLLRCQMIISECNLFSDFTKESQKSEKGSCDNSCDTSILTPEIEKVCADILNHVSFAVWDMGSQLQSEDQAKQESWTFHGSLYIFYEELVLQRLMLHLCQLFEHCSRHRCLKMAQWLLSVKLAKLDISLDRLTKPCCKHTPDKTLVLDAHTSKELNISEKAYAAKKEHSPIEDSVQGIDHLYDRYSTISEQSSDDFINHLDFEESSCLRQKLTDSQKDVAARFETCSVYVTTFAKQLTMRKLSGHKIAHQSDIEQKRKNGEPDVETGSTNDEKETFDEFCDMRASVIEVLNSNTLLGMIRKFTNTLKLLGKRLAAIRKSAGHMGKGPEGDSDISADDLLDAVVVMLKCLDIDQIHKLYSRLKLVSHLMPGFMQGGPSAFALVTFTGAFEFLFESRSH